MKELAALNGGEKVGKVPVVVLQKADGSTELLKESSDIIDHLVAAQGATSAGDAQEQARWREWVDERWVRVVTVNIYRTLGESLQTFEYMTSLGKFSALEKLYRHRIAQRAARPLAFPRASFFGRWRLLLSIHDDDLPRYYPIELLADGF